MGFIHGLYSFSVQKQMNQPCFSNTFDETVDYKMGKIGKLKSRDNLCGFSEAVKVLINLIWSGY